jgi:predicted lipid-binding transport protein (Tim44 family)
MQGSFDLFTLVFVALAVFVAWRLRSVLGTKTGHEQPPRDIFGRNPPPASGQPGQADGGNVIRLPGAPANDLSADKPFAWAGFAEPGTPVAAGLDAIAREERGFDIAGFVAGAKGAYEMIVLAFARGDRKTLKDLLSKEVYDDFDQAIGEREGRGETAETTFVSMDKAQIVSAEARGKTGFVTVKFSPKLISAVRDKSGAVIDGSAEAVVDVSETWTFSRQLGSRDPSWTLVATEAGA